MGDYVAPVSSGEAFPHSSTEIIVEPDSTRESSNSTNLQAALNQAKLRGSASEPVTVRLLAGVYEINAGLTLNNATYVSIVGAGFEHTIIRGSTTFFVPALTPTLLDISNSTHICLRGIWFDALSNGTPALVTTGASAGILAEHIDDIRLDSCKVSAIAYAMWSNAGDAGTLIEAFNCRFEAQDGVRTGTETWHMFSCDIRSDRDDNSHYSGNTTPTAIQAFGPMQIWGSHIHCEDQSTAGTAQGAVAVKQLSGHSIEIVGSTLHVVTEEVDAGRAVAIYQCSTTSAAARATFAGNNFIIDATDVTVAAATVGVCVLSSSNSSQIYSFVGNSLLESLGTNHIRGNYINLGSGTPTTKWIGNAQSAGGWTKFSGISAANFGSFSTGDIGRQGGGATLAAGVARVLLITDTGNTSETAAVFNSATTSVTGGVAFLSIFKAGDFVRRSADTDSAWTRIRNVTNTTLTLEEVYRGTNGTETAKKGTQLASSQPDGSYRISVTGPLTTEIFGVTLKHASGFLITSSVGASTSAVDWVLVR